MRRTTVKVERIARIAIMRGSVVTAQSKSSALSKPPKVADLAQGFAFALPNHPHRHIFSLQASFHRGQTASRRRGARQQSGLHLLEWIHALD